MEYKVCVECTYLEVLEEGEEEGAAVAELGGLPEELEVAVLEDAVADEVVLEGDDGAHHPGQELRIDDDHVPRGAGLAEVHDHAQVVQVHRRRLHLVLAHP